MPKVKIDVDEQPSATGEYRVDTPIRKAIVGWKMILGFKRDDRNWDKLEWGYTAKHVKPLLEVFDGDAKKLVDCMQDIHDTLAKAKPMPLECTIRTITRRAMIWKRDHEESRD